MKKIIIFCLALMAFLPYSCKEDTVKTWEGESYLFYPYRLTNYGQSIYWDSLTTFNFFFEPDVMEKDIFIKVNAGGQVYDHNRVFLVEPEVYGADAVRGLDYELSSEQIMPAGKAEATINLKLLRRAEMEGKTFDIRVWLKPNENFSVNFPWGIDVNGDTIQRHYWRVTCQAELAPPPLWEKTVKHFVGYWSVAKFEKMNEVWGTTLADWLDTESKLYKNYNNYLIVFANYLNSKISEGQDAAIKDPDKSSTRGYMSVSGFEYFGVAPTVVPANFTTTPEWEGNE